MPPKTPGIPAFVAALETEIEAFRRTVRNVTEVPHEGPGRFYTGNLIREKLLLGWTGDGRTAARTGLEALLGQHRVSRLVVLGVASGLTSGLELGHLVVAREVRDSDGLLETPDTAWIDRAMRLPGIREAIFYSNDRILTSVHDKDALGRRLLEESTSRVGAAVVDQETATYARTALAHGLPYTAIRVVSDSVNESLPIDFNAFVGDDGRIRRGSVALYALTHPWVIGKLLVRRGRVRFCGQRLSDAALFVLLSQDQPRGAVGPFIATNG